MKHTAYIVNCIYFLLICCSCNYQQKKQEEQRILDSIALAEQRTIEIADSIKAAIQKEQSLIAWGDTKFGMTFQEVKNSKTFNGGSQSDSMLFVSRDSTFISSYNFSSIYAGFYHNALYKVNISSGWQTLDNFDDILKIVEILRKKIQSKYGEPNFIEKDKEYVSSHLLDRNSVTLFSWEILNKRIDISIQHESEEYFCVNCLIYNNVLMNQVIENRKKKKNVDNGGF